MILGVSQLSAHVTEIRVNQNQDGTLTWYLQTYHYANQCGHSNAGLNINGVQYNIDAEYNGSIVALSSTVVASYNPDTYGGGRHSYATVHTPYIAGRLNVNPYSNNVCWAFLVGGNSSFNPPPPPVCTTATIVGVSSVVSLSGSDNGTPCDPTDDHTTAVVTVNHLACASITGNKQFSVVYDAAGANVVYGPFNYNTGTSTSVTINIPYGASTSTQVKAYDGFPSSAQSGLSISGGTYLGQREFVAPTVTVPANVTIGNTPGQCGATYTYAVNATDNCSIKSLVQTAGLASGSLFPRGTTVNTFTATDPSGNATTASFSVTVNDTEAPAIPVLADVKGECSATATVPTTTDNCAGTVTGTTSNPLTYSTQGTYNITWTFNDGNGNSSTANQKVIVQDVTAPVAPVLADVTGECSATVSAVPTASDNCAGTITGTTNDALSYSTQGTHTITWSFNDGNGNISTATQNVVIKDVTAPVAPVLANVTGECSATATVPTANDNCAGTVTGTTSDPLTYSAQGSYIIHWSFNDGNGNISTTTQNVIVKDVTAPVVPVLADVRGECAATATVPTTTDNCAGTVTGTTSDPLTYTAQGSYIIHWLFNDGNGNTSTANQNVIVKDVTAPTVVTKNITVLLDASGSASITPTQVDNGSFDNCKVGSLSLDKSSFNCSNVGNNTVTLTVTDVNGLSSTGTAIVTVKDVTPATVITKNISVTLVNGTASITAAQVDGGTFDNCGIKSLSVSPSTFVCGQYGSNTVKLTAVDNNGNVSFNYATVTVKGVAPIPAIAVSRTDNTFTGLNANTIALGYGAQQVTLTASNSTSAAAATTYKWSPATGLSSTTAASTVFTPTAAGTYTFTVTATNEFGCSATTTVKISVVDVRCGNKNDKVIVCHKTGSSSNPTNDICISPNAVATHLSHGDNLGSCPTTFASSATMFAQENESKISSTVKELTVVATPNPTTNVFILHITSNDVNNSASVRVVDAVGRPLDTFNKVAVGSSVTFGEMYLSGYYFAEVSQGTQHKVIKLLKAK